MHTFIKYTPNNANCHTQNTITNTNTNTKTNLRFKIKTNMKLQMDMEMEMQTPTKMHMQLKRNVLNDDTLTDKDKQELIDNYKPAKWNPSQGVSPKMLKN